MLKRGKQAELQLLHALRVENIFSSLLVGALSGAALSFVSNLCDRIVWL